MKYPKQSLQIPCLLIFTPSAFAQTYEALMKDRGTGEPVAYEPGYLKIQPGDAVEFIRKHKSHSVAPITELSPAGHSGFMGEIDEEIEVTYDNAGFYGIKCTPYYAQDMVMLIKVGDIPLLESYCALKTPGITDKRFQEVYARVNKR